MREFELKLEIPPQRLRSVREAVGQLEGRTQVLRATYYDTPSQDLRRRGIVLRVREEDGAWVQTLKASGRSAVERLEHNVPLVHSGRDTPLPNATAHANTPVGELLSKALRHGAEATEWVPLFSTEVERTACHVREGGSRIEIAFDRGRIAADHDELLLREIEFELEDGSASDLVSLARRWLERHGLWLSAISKFEKGIRLADGAAAGPPAMAREPAFARDANLEDVVHAALASCLDQVLHNASEIATGHGGSAHLHQLRIGIRRTRTVVRELVPDAREGMEPPLVEVFRALGRRRDAEYVVQQLEPTLRTAGAPTLDSSHEAASLPPPAQLVRDAAFQGSLLELVALVHDEPDGDGIRPAAARLAQRLRKLHRRTIRDGLDFERLEPQRQHRVRKRVKRLRYLAEFAVPLFRKGKARDWLAALEPVQDTLGAYNDDQAALAWYRRLAAKDPRAWFAVGWLAARAEPQAHACAESIRRFAKAKPFWE